VLLRILLSSARKFFVVTGSWGPRTLATSQAWRSLPAVEKIKPTPVVRLTAILPSQP